MAEPGPDIVDEKLRAFFDAVEEEAAEAGLIAVPPTVSTNAVVIEVFDTMRPGRHSARIALSGLEKQLNDVETIGFIAKERMKMARRLWDQEANK